MLQETTFLSRWARSQWGAAQWADTPEDIGGTLVGTGILTGTGSLVGLVHGAANFLGQGILFYILNCSRDMVLQSIQMPRSTNASVMPTAYIYELNVPSETPSCAGANTTTIPVTGSQDALTEQTSDPLYSPG